MGVLQRISLAYGLSALLIIRFDFKQMLQILTAILLLYWGLLWFGSNQGPFEVETNFARIIDIFILGEDHLYRGFGVPFDPEGILSTIPSIGTVIIGYLMGGMLHTTKNYNDCIKRMFVFGIGLIFIGYLWGFVFPINKALWTSSYVLFTGGIATIILASLTYLIDIKNFKKQFWIFEVFGTNSIFIFILSGLWVKTIINIKRDLNGEMTSAYNYLYKTVFVPLAGDINGSLLFAIAHVVGFWLILYWMYRKKIQIKL